MKYLKPLISIGFILHVSLGAWSTNDCWRADRIAHTSEQVSGLSMPMIQAQIAVESSWDHGVVGKAGERGLLQVSPIACKEFGIPRWTLDNQLLGLQSGMNIMRHNWELFPSVTDHMERWQLALACYQASHYRVLRAYWRYGNHWRRGVSAKTRRYCADVMNRYKEER